jgi:hypothetical protein
MTVALAILLVTLFGVPVALAIDGGVRGMTLIGLGYLYGAGLIYLVELTLALLGVRWSVWNVTVLAIVVAAGGVVYAARRGLESTDRVKATPIDVLTVITFLTYAVYATIARVWEWDFCAIWGLKARVFFDLGSIDWRFLENPWNSFAHADYPLLLPMNYVHAALVAGGWDDRWMGLINVAFGGALLLIVRGLSARESRPIVSSTIAFAVTLFVLSRYVGMAEGPLIAYAGAAILFLRRAVLFDDEAAMRHGALLSGLAAATKNEGLALLVTISIVLLLTKRRLVLKMWPGFLLALPWVIVRMLHRFPTDLASGPFLARIVERSREIVSIVPLFLQYLNMRWMWLAILVALLVVAPGLRSRERFVLLVVALQAALYVAIILGGPNAVDWQIATSWSRLVSQLATPLLAVVMLMLARTFEARPDH